MGIFGNIFGQKRAAVQHATVLDTLPNIDEETASNATLYRGNPYTTYAKQVLETARKYEGKAVWGNQPTRAIIDLRAGFTVGGGLSVQTDGDREDAKQEMEFANKFIEENHLDGRKPFDWAIEAEIEGKILLKLFMREDGETPQVRSLSWRDCQYTVVANPEDYEDFLHVKYTRHDNDQEVKLLPHEFVYQLFGGRQSAVNDPCTRIGPTLPYIENMDKAIRDWREIDALFASPTPVFICETAEQVATLEAWIKRAQWRIGKAFIGSGCTYELREYSGAGAQTVKDEIARNAAMVSAATGLPLHWIGFPELLSNRSTSDNLAELVLAATSHERFTWSVVYTMLVRKAMEMAYTGKGKRFDPKKVKIVVSEIGAYRIEQLVDVWLPLFTNEALSLETLLEKTPEVDAFEEMQRLDRDRKQRQEEFMQSAGPRMDDRDPEEVEDDAVPSSDAS